MQSTLRFITPIILFGMTLSAYGTESLSSKPEGQQKPLEMQLHKDKEADDKLGAVLGTGNNVLLNLSMDLSALKRPIEKEQLEKGQLEVPVQLFLTDFKSVRTDDSPVTLTVKIDCDSTPPVSIFPDKPASFVSYAQFTDWFNKGYFTNEVNITYDFSIASLTLGSLAGCLFSHAVPPAGYRFIGTYAFCNANITPDKHLTEVTYLSERGSINRTVITLHGSLYMNNKAYPMDDHQQVIPHPLMGQVNLKKDATRKFYSHDWIAHSETTKKTTYMEFPGNQIQNWPDVPSETYVLSQKKPDDLEAINHLKCFDGETGKDVDISDGKFFEIDIENIATYAPKPLESLVRDKEGKLYNVQYFYVGSERLRPAEAEKLRQEAERKRYERLVKLQGFENFPYLKAKTYDEKAIALLESHDKEIREKTASLQYALAKSTHIPNEIKALEYQKYTLQQRSTKVYEEFNEKYPEYCGQYRHIVDRGKRKGYDTRDEEESHLYWTRYCASVNPMRNGPNDGCSTCRSYKQARQQAWPPYEATRITREVDQLNEQIKTLSDLSRDSEALAKLTKEAQCEWERVIRVVEDVTQRPHPLRDVFKL